VAIRQDLPAHSVRNRNETEKNSGGSGTEKRGEASRLNKNRGRAEARLERSGESEGVLAGGESEKR
jgi:hypothetical protein